MLNEGTSHSGADSVLVLEPRLFGVALSGSGMLSCLFARPNV